MDIESLAQQYAELRPGIVLEETQVLGHCLAATRFYAGYGDIRSLSGSGVLQSAPGDGKTRPAALDPEPDVLPALPVTDIEMIDEGTDLTVGEWAIIKPLFVLYIDKENAMLLEATRGMGADPYGRSVSEIAQEISVMETDTLPAKAFQHAIITV